jgi:hypothetical protein
VRGTARIETRKSGGLSSPAKGLDTPQTVRLLDRRGSHVQAHEERGLTRDHIACMKGIVLLAAWCGAAAMLAEQTVQSQREQFEQRISEIERRHVPDKRLDWFSIEVRQVEEGWLVVGETSVLAALDAVAAAAEAVFGRSAVRIEVEVLPGPALKRKTHLLTCVSVAPVRRQPRHSAEMVDQVLMGTVLGLLKEEKGWFLVQTPYGYVGWMESSSLLRVSDEQAQEWKGGPLVRFEELYGSVWSSAARREPVADAVLGCVFKPLRRTGPWQIVALPDGRQGYVPARSVVSFPAEDRNWKASSRDILESARRLRGVPYLWGGNSAKGFDCSGFVQTVFKINGILLPRDSDQQAELGAEVTPDGDFGNVKPADLLFFGSERVTHVAVSLGRDRFIHCSGEVRINSLNEQDPAYDAQRRRSLRTIRRIISE